MRHACLGAGLALCSAIAVAGTTSSALALEKVRLGWCTSVITHGVAPIAVATKFGWFKQEGIEVELVNFPGSSDCVRNVATGEVLVAVATPEPVAILQQTGVNTQVFYTAYRRNIFGVAVPVDSSIKTYADLKDKKIGVTSMASAGVVLARSATSDAGLDPDRDIRVVISGQPAQSVILLQRKEIDAVSQWDTQYTLMGLAGLPMRMLEDPLIDSFPANSLVASSDSIKNKRDLLVRLARAYTMGVAYTLKNTRQAAAIFQEVYPQIVPTGLAPEAALDRTATLLKTVSEKWTLDKPGETWGESDLKIYQSYLDWLVRAKILKQPMDAKEIATNELVGDINKNLDIKSAEEASAR
jgi:NitT/TauT family transport system substrate-binding protein